MENGKKISELPEITQLTGYEEIPVEVGGKNGRIKSGAFQTKGNYALKDEIPDTSNFITKMEAAEIYIPEAPKDGKTYGRNNGAWVKVESGGGSTSEPPAGGYNRALFEAAGAVYNEETGFYELNGLTDITEEEMLVIYTDGIGKMAESINFSGWYEISNARTNILPNVLSTAGWETRNLVQSFRIIPNMEVIRLSKDDSQFDCKDSSFMLYFNAPKLKRILGILNVWGNLYNVFTTTFAAPNLEEIYVKGIRKGSASLRFCSKICYNSIKYLIDNTANTSAITIIVHPTTYSYLTGTAEPTEQVGGTTEEWQALVTTAAEKQISFATE